MTISSEYTPRDPISTLLDDRGRGLVRVAILFTIALAIPFTVVSGLLIGRWEGLLQSPLLYCEIAYSALGLWYLRRQPQLAVAIVLWGLTFSVLLQCAWGRGIHSAGAITLPALLIIACFMLPRRQALFLGALCMAALSLLALFDERFYASYDTRAPSVILIAYLFAIGLSASAALMIARKLGQVILNLRTTSEQLSLKLSELQQSRDSFARMFKMVPVPLAISTRATGLHLDVNDAWCRNFGLRRNQVIGRTSLEMGLWTDPVRRQDWADSVTNAGGEVVTRLVQLTDAGGKPHDMMLSAQVVRHGAEECLFSASVDLTEHMQAEAEVHRLNGRLAQQVGELKRSQAKFEALFSLAPVAISVSLLADGRYFDINPAWELAVGRSRADVVGKTSFDLDLWPTPADRQRWVASLQQAKGRCRDYQINLRVASGEVRSFLTDSQIVDYNGQQCIIAAFVDITERLRIEAELRELNARMEERVQERTRRLTETVETLHRAQEELVHAEKLASLGSLVAGVAHELNTPIGNAVLINSTLAAELERMHHALAGQSLKRSELERFIAATGHANGLLERSLGRARDLVRSFKQVAIDQTSERRRQFGLNELVRDVCETLRPSIRNPLWQLDIAVGEELMLDSYPGPLGQVLTNLIQNALVHGLREDRPGQVAVAVERLADEQVRLTVSDNGAGIDSENIGHIFDPFFTTRLGHGGSGLGLNIVYGIVTKLLGGRIGVESAPGEGCRFTLLLPMQAPANA